MQIIRLVTVLCFLTPFCLRGETITIDSKVRDDLVQNFFLNVVFLATSEESEICEEIVVTKAKEFFHQTFLLWYYDSKGIHDIDVSDLSGALISAAELHSSTFSEILERRDPLTLNWVFKSDSISLQKDGIYTNRGDNGDLVKIDDVPAFLSVSEISNRESYYRIVDMFYRDMGTQKGAEKGLRLKMGAKNGDIP